jgi:hypothetical protein
MAQASGGTNRYAMPAPVAGSLQQRTGLRIMIRSKGNQATRANGGADTIFKAGLFVDFDYVHLQLLKFE